MSEKSSPPSSDNQTRLAELRALLTKNGIGAYVVLTQDEHNSEYVSEADERRAFISGFTGSAGTAVITHDKAALATDGRYFLQAGKQLSSDWELLKQGVKDVPTWQQWVANEAAEKKFKIGVDPRLITYQVVQSLKSTLKKKGIADALVPLEENLIDKVWGTQRPARSAAPVFELTKEYTGKDFEDKIADLRKTIAKENGTAIIVSALDEIAWLFNLRGQDIAFNPVFFAYALVSKDQTNLYINSSKITEKVRAHLGSSVAIKPYEDVFEDSKLFASSLVQANANIEEHNKQKLLLANGASWGLVNALGGESNIKFINSPIENAKGVKNETELAGQRIAQIRDGAAVTKYLAWLEDALKKGTKITDYEGGQKCLEFRKQMENFRGLSFETISSSGPNAAVIHYSPPTDSDALIDINEVYLLDSGGQYLEGTTDTTRTHHFGTPRPEEKKAYTLVLKGHIGLADVVFPENSNGYQLDVLARQHLWKEGLDYRHGTGHGVGAFLNVHEGPIGIAPRKLLADAPFSVGNVISNEPGYYEDGKYGIRIESLVAVKDIKTPNNFGGTKFQGFETLTAVPLCRTLIDLDLITATEKKWINDYHSFVFEKIESFFKKDEPAFEWLKRETAPL